MIQSRLLILAFTITFFCANAQKAHPDTPVLLETERIVKTLASDELAGRKPGTDGFAKAAAFVENELAQSGIRPFFATYKDTFQTDGTTTYNVVGEIKAAIKTDEYIIISAHLDHLGINAYSASKDSIYNGANDNASGCTAVAQISKALNSLALNKNVLVVFFSGEEDGLRGSEHLAAKLKQANVNLKYVFNFEMIGKTLSTGADQVYLTGFQKSDMADAINKILKKDFIRYLPAENQFQLFTRSDNYPFYQQFHIPSQTISTFDFKNYAYYHELKDDFSELDIENMNAVIVSSTQALAALLTSDIKIKLKE